MATNIDERIVAAKFDASDFEKGVNKTIKKLDELKKSLDLKDATKGVKELAEKTEASTDSMSKSLEKLTERFTTFVGMIKQRILGGLADEVANVFLRMEQSVTGFIRSISSDQVQAGMAKYEQMLTSVRIMMSAGDSEQEAYKYIGYLRDYSDQTSYSLSQMTDALSKMRAAGIDLDTATKSVEGIANACANAGINAQDAQRAFYNLSQAYSSGVLKYTDYRSLELLNMTTKEFKQQLLEAAVQAKTLKKVSDGVYQTINTGNKKVTAGKRVTEQNLQDMLRYNFVTSDVLNELFGGKFFFDEKAFKEYKRKYKTLDEAIAAAKKDYGETAVNAYLAAREARSFTDVVNTLKDVVSTGWSTSFEKLFGQLEKAKTFFTNLAEGELADFIYKIGEYRNAILEFWDDGINGVDSGGGEVFRQTILNITDAIGTLLKTILDLLPGFHEFEESEGEMNPEMESLADRFFMLTMRIRDFSLRIKDGAENFRIFMNSKVLDDGTTRIELIRQTLGNLASVLTIIGKVAIIAFNTIAKTFNTLTPIFDGFLVLLSKVTEPLVNLKNDTKVFKDIEYSIDNIFTVLNPVAEVLGKVVGFLGEVGAFFAQMAIDTVTSNISFFSDAIGLVFELFTNNSAQMKDGEGVLARIQADFEGIKTACQAGLNALKEFFGALLGDIRRLLGLTDEAEKKSGDQNGGIFSGLTNFFNTNQFVQDAKAWVNQAIVDVTAFIKSIPSRVMQLGGNIYDTLRGLFFKDETKDNGSQLETKTILTPLGEWVNQAIIDIKNFFISLPQRIIDGVGKFTNWIDEVFNYWFAEQKNTNENITSYKMENGEWKQTDTIFASRFEQFIANAKISISKWFEDLPNKIRNAFSSIGNFASNLYKSLDEFLFGKKVRQTISVADGKGGLKYKDVTVRYKSGFSKWLDGVIKDIKKFISNIPEYIKSGIRGAGDIINTIISALFGKEDGKEVTSKDVTESLEKPFLGIDLGSILNTIAGIGREILNQIARIFTGTDDIDKNMNWFSETIAKGINWIREKAIEGLNWLSTTLAELPTTIANLFSHEDKDNANAGPVGTAIIGFGEAIGTFITVTLPDKILEFITNATNAFDNIWNELYNKIVGGAEETTEESTEQLKEAVETDPNTGEAPELSAWEKFVEKLGQTISNIWQKLPVWIAEGINLAILGIDELISGFTDRIAEANAQKKASETTEEVFKEVTKDMADSAEEGEASEESGLLDAIKGIGERIRDLFIITIPGFISEAWTAISNLGSDIYKGISSIFSGEPVGEDASELTKMAANAGQLIYNFITRDVPAKFEEAWTWISENATNIFKGVSSIFTGETPVGEVQTAVNKFGTIIYKAITEDIPAAIKKAFDFVKGLFTKKDPLEENLKLLPDSEKVYVSRYVDKMKKDTKNVVEDETENPESWSFIDGIKEGFLNAFNSIGPAILEGIAKGLDWIGNIMTIIIDALTGKTSIGDQVEKTYKKEQPELRKALTHIGESLKTFFLETLPTFIGAAMGSLLNVAQTWIGNFFKGVDATVDKESKDHVNKEAETLNNAILSTPTDLGPAENIDKLGDPKDEKTPIGGVVSFINNFISSLEGILSSDITKTVAIIIGIGFILSALRDLFSLSDEVEAFSKTLKWTALTIAVAAITGIVAHIASIVQSGDTEKLDAVDKMLDKVANLFEKIQWIVVAFSAAKIVESLTDLFGRDKIQYTGGIGARLGGNILSGFTSLFSNFFGLVGAGAGTDIALKLGASGVDTFISTITESLVEMTSGFETMLSFINPFVDDMYKMSDKLDTAIIAAHKVGELYRTLIAEFMGWYKLDLNAIGSNGDAAVKELIDSIRKDNVGDDIVEITGEELYTALDTFMKLSVFIKNISEALSTLNNVPDVSKALETAKKTFISKDFLGLLTGLLTELATAFGSSGAIFISDRPLSVMSYGLDILADTMSIFGNSLKGFTSDDVKTLNSVLQVLFDLAEALKGVSKWSESSLSKAFGTNSELSEAGRQIKVFGSYMKDFYGYIVDIPGFKSEEVDETNAKVKSIVDLMKGAASAAAVLSNVALGDLDLLGEKMPSLGHNLATMFNSFNDQLNASDVEKLEAISASVQAVASVFYSLSQMNANGNTGFFETVSTIFNKMSEENNYSRLADILSMMSNAIISSLTNEESLDKFEQTGKTLAHSLITGIQSALDSDPTLRITPVLNLDTAKGQLKQLFGIEELENVDLSSLARSAAGANSFVDEERVKSSELYGKIGEVASAINDLKDSQTTLEQLTTAFSKLKMYINKNVLVGEITDDIDYRIGLKIDLVNGNITP